MRRFWLAFALLPVLLCPLVGFAAGDECMPLGAGGCVRVPIMNGKFPPATCIPGELFLDTDETVDTNCTTTNDNSLCLCVAANTWTQLNNN